MTTEIICGAALLCAALASARWTWWRSRAPGLPVLVYHNIGEPPAASTLTDLWISPQKFRAQISWLLARGYVPLLFSDLLKAQKNGKALPEKAVLITFDGAYEDTYTFAYRALHELGAKGNVFVAFNTIGKADLWQDPGTEPWINMATLDMLKEMRDSGLIEFGSHTMNHPDLAAIPPEDAAWELTESRKQLETALELEIRAFSYPYGSGAGSPEIRELVLKAGYTMDFGLKHGKARWPRGEDAGPIERMPVTRGDTTLDLNLFLTKGASRLI
jgi:peptidoglycan/xylan/chitin deacetylase (PgdA/CDA1 family)